MMSSFPLVSFLITLMLAAAVCTNGEEPVKDTVGNEVRTGVQYFIQPVKTNGGGLVIAPPDNYEAICPLAINLAPNKDATGLPVSFEFPTPLIGATVLTRETVNIEFRSESDAWPCPNFSKLWEVNETSLASKEPAILIGGERLNPNNWFRIEKAGERAGANIYKLTTLTGTVGTIPGPWSDAPKLVLTTDTAKTLLVKFIKVDDPSTATSSISRVEKLGLSCSSTAEEDEDQLLINR